MCTVLFAVWWIPNHHSLLLTSFVHSITWREETSLGEMAEVCGSTRYFVSLLYDDPTIISSSTLSNAFTSQGENPFTEKSLLMRTLRWVQITTLHEYAPSVHVHVLFSVVLLEYELSLTQSNLCNPAMDVEAQAHCSGNLEHGKRWGQHEWESGTFFEYCNMQWRWHGNLSTFIESNTDCHHIPPSHQCTASNTHFNFSHYTNQPKVLSLHSRNSLARQQTRSIRKGSQWDGCRCGDWTSWKWIWKD